MNRSALHTTGNDDRTATGWPNRTDISCADPSSDFTANQRDDFVRTEAGPQDEGHGLADLNVEARRDGVNVNLPQPAAIEQRIPGAAAVSRQRPSPARIQPIDAKNWIIRSRVGW